MDDQTFRNSSGPLGPRRYLTWTRLVLIPGSKSFQLRTTALSRIWSSVMLVQVAICTGELVMVLLGKNAHRAAGWTNSGSRPLKIQNLESNHSILMHFSDAYNHACCDGNSNCNHPRDFRDHKIPLCTSDRELNLYRYGSRHTSLKHPCLQPVILSTGASVQM